jgi:hypothetical protein
MDSLMLQLHISARASRTPEWNNGTHQIAANVAAFAVDAQDP